MNQARREIRIIYAILFLGSCFGVTQQANAQQWYRTKPPDPPKWSLELKSGDFEPELEDFRTFYGSDTSKHSAIAIGYKLLRTVDVGIEYGRMRNTGVGQLPLNGGTGGEVTFTMEPVHAYILLRGIWGEDQIGVPYIGGGVTRVSYKEDILNQPSRKGTVDGSHYRYGLQLLLDRGDTSLAREMQSDYGTDNTYLYIEKQHFEAEVDGVQLGGDTTFIGILFEF